ncbi:hypothetical protein EJ02DRAFT_237201 [Clathrospora elynae]|uniref:Uncharacterized protein n=1 Tax=Clathrospora elynae TaxID=706981 RepID=A0A6A5SK98_9PLEO|nr:hypothetical protein EJ02DRAFT_237201 [Clathrospora elynae]
MRSSFTGSQHLAQQKRCGPQLSCKLLISKNYAEPRICTSSPKKCLSFTYPFHLVDASEQKEAERRQNVDVVKLTSGIKVSIGMAIRCR